MLNMFNDPVVSFIIFYLGTWFRFHTERLFPTIYRSDSIFDILIHNLYDASTSSVFMLTVALQESNYMYVVHYINAFYYLEKEDKRIFNSDKHKSNMLGSYKLCKMV